MPVSSPMIIAPKDYWFTFILFRRFIKIISMTWKTTAAGTPVREETKECEHAS